MSARLAATATQVAAHTSAARAPNKTAPICVHLTPFARRCERMPIHDRGRWKVFYGLTPLQAVRVTLKRLHLAPVVCRAALEGESDVALLAPVPPEVLRLVSSDSAVAVPHAIFWDGLTVEQLQQALADLIAAGWTPDPPSPTA